MCRFQTMTVSVLDLQMFVKPYSRHVQASERFLRIALAARIYNVDKTTCSISPAAMQNLYAAALSSR
jgi:hypothetical protein